MCAEHCPRKCYLGTVQRGNQSHYTCYKSCDRTHTTVPKKATQRMRDLEDGRSPQAWYLYMLVAATAQYVVCSDQSLIDWYG